MLSQITFLGYWTRSPDTRHLGEDRISTFFTGKRYESHSFTGIETNISS